MIEINKENCKLIGQSSKSIILQTVRPRNQNSQLKQSFKNYYYRNIFNFNFNLKYFNLQLLISNNFVDYLFIKPLKIVENVAVKFIPHQENDVCDLECKTLKNEFMIQQQIEHTNVIKQYEIHQNVEIKQLNKNNGCLVIMELGNPKENNKVRDMIDLANVSKKNYGNLEIVKNLFKQILEGLKAIHDKNIAHNDLKLENFIVFDYNFSKNQFLVKIGDFGFAAFQNMRNKSLQKKEYRVRKLSDKFAPELYQLVDQKQDSNQNKSNNSKDQNDDNNNTQRKKSRKNSQNEQFQQLQQNQDLQSKKINQNTGFFEYFNDSYIDEKQTDMFAIGICMAEWVLKTNLKIGISDDDPAFQAFRQGNYDVFWEYFPQQYQSFQKYVLQKNEYKKISQFFDLLQNLITEDQNLRYNVDQALNHCFFDSL